MELDGTIYYVEFTIWVAGNPIGCVYVVKTNSRDGDGVVRGIKVEKGTTEGFQDVYIYFDDTSYFYPDAKVSQIKYK